MLASQRVNDSEGNTVGFVVNGAFYTEDYIRENICYIENLSVTEKGIIRPEKELPEISYKEGILGKLYRQKVRENPFVRDIQRQLSSWKKDPLHRVLQLEGSRQIGKTTELQKFAYGNYEYVIYVNMASDVYDFKEVIRNGARPLEFEKYCRKAGLPHFADSENTILIIDEIQQSAFVYNAIRTIEENISCDLIVTGSYLGRFLANIKSEKEDVFFSAGTIQQMKMYPLSFQEFCRIFGKEEELLNISLYGESEAKTYQELLRFYEIYRQIGGYPAVVKEYIQNQNITDCHRVIESLLSVFRDESRNYFSNEVEVEMFDEIYDFTLTQMCVNHAGSDRDMLKNTAAITEERMKNIISTRELRNALVWLKYSGIIDTCNLARDGKLSEQSAARKLYFQDCGIAAYLAKNSGAADSILNGILTETFVFNELQRLFTVDYTQRKVKNRLHYGTYGSYELDFMLMDTDDTVYGIEVKTATGDPKSLKIFIEKRLVDRGIVAKPTQGGHAERFDTIPIYTVGCRFPYKVNKADSKTPGRK